MPLQVKNIVCNILSFSCYFHPGHAEELRTGYVMRHTSGLQHFHADLGKLSQLVLNHLLDVEFHHKNLVSNDYSWANQG